MRCTTISMLRYQCNKNFLKRQTLIVHPAPIMHVILGPKHLKFALILNSATHV